ncbi:MAG: hypothetical protein HBSIN02_16200 [Bacteroidia bacterium]|nr:MAG: hypothetical protein HBSIN02_16200 [Bacteroidia bacterium]
MTLYPRIPIFLQGVLLGRIIIFLLFPFLSAAQDTVRIMTYNLLRYGDNVRDAHFRTVIQSVRPDILVVQEIDSVRAVPGFLFNVLNANNKEYAVGILRDGPDSDNAIFYKPAFFLFLENNPIRTALRDINEFVLKHVQTGRIIRIFGVHLNAGLEDSLKRAAEADSLRAVTNRLPEGSDFIVVGDFNIYGPDEPAYRKLTDSGTSRGHAVDPVSITGRWNSATNAIHHTQSTRLRAFAGGAVGGLDDRFDMILVSPSIRDGEGIRIVPGSYRAFGNDGLHYNDSISRPPNNAVHDSVAHALHEASDHLPVVCDLVFDVPVSTGKSRSHASESVVEIFQVFPHPVPSDPRVPIRIRFSLRRESLIQLRMYTLLGQVVWSADERLSASGVHDFVWTASRAAGVYFLELNAGGERHIKKLVVIP